MNFTPDQMVASILHYSAELDGAEREYEIALHHEANTKEVVRVALAIAWSEVEGPNREYREALVEADASDLLRHEDLAVGHTKWCFEKIRNKRQQLSAIQTSANSVKEVSQYERVGPEVSELEQRERVPVTAERHYWPTAADRDSAGRG